MSPAPALADSDIGEALRAARKRREMTLEDIAKTTKIRVAILRAIENNQRNELPDTIFLRGFVRAYAREVGLDPNDIARQYVEQFAPIEPVESGPESEGKQEKRSPEASTANEMISVHGGRGGAAQWAAIAILATGVIGYGIVSRSRQNPGTPAPPKADRAEAAAGTSGSLPPRAAAEPADVVLHLKLRATARCWVSANVDGTRVMYSLLQPGEEHALEIRHDAVLRIGEPTAVAVSIDGLPARSLGRPGAPVTVHITSDNYREFIAR